MGYTYRMADYYPTPASTGRPTADLKAAYFGLISLLSGDLGLDYSGAKVIRTGTNQAIASATLTPVQFNGELWDTNGYHDPATNNSRLTVSEDGRYRIDAQISLRDLDSGDDRQAYLYRNGVSVGQVYRRDGGTGTMATVVFSAILDAVAGDYFEVVLQQGGGAGFAVRAEDGMTSVHIQKLG